MVMLSDDLLALGSHTPYPFPGQRKRLYSHPSRPFQYPQFRAFIFNHLNAPSCQCASKALTRMNYYVQNQFIRITEHFWTRLKESLCKSDLLNLVSSQLSEIAMIHRKHMCLLRKNTTASQNLPIPGNQCITYALQTWQKARSTGKLANWRIGKITKPVTKTKDNSYTYFLYKTQRKRRYL